MTSEEKTALREAARALQKDPDGAFAAFFDLSKDKVYFLLLSYVHDTAEAEDLLQETYLAYLEHLHSLSFALNPIAYLLSIAKNKALDSLRARHPALELDAEGGDESIGEEEAPPDDTAPLLLAVRRILSPFEFQIFTLHVLSEMSFKEIAHELHRPIGTLTYTYSEAIHKLQKGLDPSWMNALKKN